MQLRAGEAIIAQTPSRWERTGETGTLVLTTERLIFVDGFACERSEIERAEQWDPKQLWIYRPGVLGEGFTLTSPMAGPVRWTWYLERPATTHTLRDRMWGRANDPRLGIVDDGKRAIVDLWYRMACSWTAGPPRVEYLDGLPEVPVDWSAIAELVYIADGRGDGPNWLLVARLADGRWIYFTHVVQITGEVYSTTIVAASLETIWWGAMSEEDRDRVTAQMTQERLDEELVRLDALQESADANLRAHAEYRATQIRFARKP